MNDLNEIKNLIAEANLSNAILLLQQKFGNSKFEKEITLIKSRYQSLENKNIKGIISEADFKLEANKVSDSLLSLIENLEKYDSNYFQSSRVKKKNKRKVVFAAIGLVFLVSSVGLYFLYFQDNTFKCKDYIEFMTISVDDFEKELEGMSPSEKDVMKIKEGKFKNKSIQYRKYGGGSVHINNYFSLIIYPDTELFILETSSTDTQAEVKKRFQNCGFKFLNTNANGTDIYKKGNLRLLLAERKVGALVDNIGGGYIYSFQIEKE